ncbi:MAG: YggS family pyridoxal phosphate-dependent enzyme [Clostridia bacterium]|nr:YggS family pyridoxal phosphate-dependent enzyme [Clostridia bacterium]
MGIAENIADIRKKLDKAAPGRRVLLVAATKMNDAARVREAVAAGVDACGENRVQELLKKKAEGAYEGAPLHFIGHLQKNKVKQIVGVADLIESADSKELLRLIDSRALDLGIIQDVLLEVNISGEESKSGMAPEALPGVLEYASGLHAVRVRGLMTIPPICENPGGNKPFFARMNELFIDIKANKYDNVCMDFLSMGMSGDFEDAAAMGANLVRVGTAIFGARDYGT